MPIGSSARGPNSPVVAGISPNPTLSATHLWQSSAYRTHNSQGGLYHLGRRVQPFHGLCSAVVATARYLLACRCHWRCRLALAVSWGEYAPCRGLAIPHNPFQQFGIHHLNTGIVTDHLRGIGTPSIFGNALFMGRFLNAFRRISASSADTLASDIAASRFDRKGESAVLFQSSPCP